MTAGHLKAGIAEHDITPAPGGLLAAEFAPRTGQSVESPLMAKALILANGQSTLALVTLDLYGLDRKTAARLQEAVALRCGLAPAAVLIACSHTRGGPYTTGVVGHPYLDEAYLEKLLEVIPEVVAEANGNLRDSSLGLGKVKLPHLVYNHRLLTRNLKAVTAWLGLPDNEVLEPEGPVDPEFSVLVLRDPKGFPLGLLWNFAADNRFPADGQISAGLPGQVQAEVDRRIGRHLPLFYLPGCGGNASFSPGLGQSIAADVASAVMAAYLETSCDPHIRLDCASETIILPVRDYSCLWSQADIELKQPQALDAYLREIEILQKGGEQAVAVQIQALRLGRFALVGFPGVPFAGFGLALKRAAPAQATIVVGNTGGHLGYVIPRQAFEDEGFEAWPARSALIGPGGGEFMVEEAERLVRTLWKS